MLAEGDKDVVANFGIRQLTGLKPKRLKQHQDSAAHLAAVKRLLQPDRQVGEPLAREISAPAEADFEAMLAHIRRGGSMRQGLALQQSQAHAVPAGREHETSVSLLDPKFHHN